jgi:hypothetical protein
MRIVLAVVPILLSLPFLIPDVVFGIADAFRLTKEGYLFLRTIPFALFGISLFSILMIYLQTGFKPTSEFEVVTANYDAVLSQQSKEQLTGFRELSQLKAELLDLKTQLEHARIDQPLTDDQRVELGKLIKDRLLSEQAQEVVAQFRSLLEAVVSQDERRKIVGTIFGNTLQRLNFEVSALGRRGNINLCIGILTALAGLIVLGELVFRGTLNPKSALDLSAHYIPRLTLVIFIEIFAYFFLKLYKASLSEIKYFQNEMTNIEAKQTALAISLDEHDKTTRPTIIKTLANTERNAVFKKGETTLELERLKLDKDAISEIIPKLLAPLKANSK